MTKEELLKIKLTSPNIIIKKLITTILGEVDRSKGQTKKDKNGNVIILDPISIEDAMKKWHKNNSQLLENLDDSHPSYISLLEENKFMEKYLPKQLTLEEISNIIFECKENNISSVKDIMNYFSANYSGLYNGRDVVSILNGKLK